MLRPVCTAVVACAVLWGCLPPPIQVDLLEPRPNLALVNDRERTLSLSLGPGISDQFSVPAHDRIPSTTVRSWQETLTNGFRAAFKPYFTVASPSELVVAIDRADIDWAPLGVSGKGIVTAVQAQITYKARLLDSRRNTIAAAASTATSKSPAIDYDGLERCLTSAVETMYEDMAQQLFAGASGLRASK